MLHSGVSGVRQPTLANESRDGKLGKGSRKFADQKRDLNRRISGRKGSEQQVPGMSHQGSKAGARSQRRNGGWALSGGFPQLPHTHNPFLMVVKQCQALEKDGKHPVRRRLCNFNPQTGENLRKNK